MVVNILNSGKAKNEEGVKIHKEAADDIKKQISKILFRVKSRKKQITEAAQMTFSIKSDDRKEAEGKAKFKTAE